MVLDYRPWRLRVSRNRYRRTTPGTGPSVGIDQEWSARRTARQCNHAEAVDTRSAWRGRVRLRINTEGSQVTSCQVDLTWFAKRECVLSQDLHPFAETAKSFIQSEKR